MERTYFITQWQSAQHGGQQHELTGESGRYAVRRDFSRGTRNAGRSVTIGSATHQNVVVNWSAAAGANFYTVYRSTLFDNGGGASNVLGTIVLNNTNTTTSYTDTTPTDGSIYSYFVTATSAGGTSTNSAAAAAKPLPTPPASAPGSFNGLFNGANIVLNWSSVPGAVGYIVRRGTSSGGPYTYVQNVTETTFTDTGLNTGTT